MAKEEVHSPNKLTCNLASFNPNEEAFNVSKEEICSLSEEECGQELVSIISNGVTYS